MQTIKHIAGYVIALVLTVNAIPVTTWHPLITLAVIVVVPIALYVTVAAVAANTEARQAAYAAEQARLAAEQAQAEQTDEQADEQAERRKKYMNMAGAARMLKK